MPNKPTTLREEFDKFIDDKKWGWMDEDMEGNRTWNVDYETIADWWLGKLTSHNTELLQKIEALETFATGMDAYDFKKKVLQIINQEK